MFQVQCYSGFPEKLQVGAGFRLSDGPSPVSLIKYAHRWNPFVDLEDEEEIWGDKYGVCTLQKWSQRWTKGYVNSPARLDEARTRNHETWGLGNFLLKLYFPQKTNCISDSNPDVLS